MGLNPGTGSRIQFQFRQCINLHRKNGGTPNAAVHAVYTVKGKKAQTLSTKHRKGKDPEWIENTAIIRNVSPETEFTFVILDSPGALSILPAKVLATSKPYTVGELIRLKSEAEDSVSSAYGGASTGFAVPLIYTDSSAVSEGGDNDSTATLVLAVHDFLDERELKQYYAKVKEEWSAKNRRDLEHERAAFAEDLRLLGADIPNNANSKTYVDVAAGLFASIGPLFDNERIINQRRVLDLIASYRKAIEQLRFTANAQSAELVIQFYGKVCLEIADSLRYLERFLREPANMEDNGVIAEIDRKTRHFEHYPQNTDNPLGHRDLILRQRASLRKGLIASNPTLIDHLRHSILDMDYTTTSTSCADKAVPSSSCSSSRHPASSTSSHRPSRLGLGASTVQALASWALLSSHATVNRLLWLTGPAGCGKTAVAGALADAVGRVGGVESVYWTFSAAGEEVGSRSGSSLRCMAETLAFQIAAYVDGVEGLVSNAASAAASASLGGKGGEGEGFEGLFEKLVISPLQAVSRSRREAKSSSSSSTKTTPGQPLFRPILIILDDVDQCSPSQLDRLLSVLSPENLANKVPRECRILLVSREVSAIREVYEKDLAVATIVDFYHSSSGGGGGMGSARPTPSRSSSIKWASTSGGGSSSAATAAPTPTRRGSVGSASAGARASRSGSFSRMAVSEFQIMEVPR